MLVRCTPRVTVFVSETTRQLTPMELLRMPGPKLTTILPFHNPTMTSGIDQIVDSPWLCMHSKSQSSTLFRSQTLLPWAMGTNLSWHGNTNACKAEDGL